MQRFRVGLGLTVALLLHCACQSGGDTVGRGIDECSTACARIGYTNCGDVGEECIDRCVRVDLPVPAECPQEYQAYTNCFWLAESYSCDDHLGTVATGCDAELLAVRTCLGLGDASAADAAGSAVNAPAPGDAAASDAAGDP
jgi:hypothetical protein